MTNALTGKQVETRTRQGETRALQKTGKQTMKTESVVNSRKKSRKETAERTKTWLISGVFLAISNLNILV